LEDYLNFYLMEIVKLLITILILFNQKKLYLLQIVTNELLIYVDLKHKLFFPRMYEYFLEKKALEDIIFFMYNCDF